MRGSVVVPRWVLAIAIAIVAARAQFGHQVVRGTVAVVAPRTRWVLPTLILTAAAAAASAALSYWKYKRLRLSSLRLAKANDAIVSLLLRPLDEREEATEEEIKTGDVNRARKLRHVVAAAKVKFGGAPAPTAANREVVSRFVREYMAGGHGSPLKMPPHVIRDTEGIVTNAVLTPSAAAVAAAEMWRTNKILYDLRGAYAAATGGWMGWLLDPWFRANLPVAA